MWLAVKLVAALVFYGAAIEPRFVQRVDQPAVVPNLPAAWEGQHIAVFADLQVGMWLANTDAARRVVHDVVALRPAAVLIAGDFVYQADHDVDAQMTRVLAILQPLIASHIPVYGVLGNHDYSLFNEHSQKENAVAHRVRVMLDSAGVRMLNNRAVVLALPPDSTAPGDSAAVRDTATGAPRGDSAGVRLYLVGVGEKWARNDHPVEALAQVPDSAPRIVFMHDPDSFAKIPAGEAPFAVAAHTHGLQVGIPFVSNWLWRHFYSDSGSDVAGWDRDFGQPHNELYINRGIGFSILPVRLHCVPELTVFTLERPKKP